MSSQDRTRSRVQTYVGPALFCIFFLVGVAYILFAKLIGLPGWATTSIPIALMIAYAACMTLLPGARLRSDQAGDNLYYIGFLYTLTSLGVSLYQFSGADDASDIVRNFGIAVASTIVGVFLRVMFNQMRKDPVEVEHIARLELAEAARKVRRELDATVVELSHFRRATQQQISEGFEHVRQAMEEVSGRILGNFENLTVRAAKPFESASENSGAVLTSLAYTIGNSLDAAAKRLAEENEKLAGQTAGIAVALEVTADRLSAMQTPDKVVEVRIAPVVDALGEAVTEFSRQSKERAEAERSLLEAVARSSRAQEEQARLLGEAVEQVRTATASMAESGGKSLEHSERVLDLMQSMEEKVAAQTDRALEAARAIQEQASSQSEWVSSALGDLERQRQANESRDREVRQNGEMLTLATATLDEIALSLGEWMNTHGAEREPTEAFAPETRENENRPVGAPTDESLRAAE